MAAKVLVFREICKRHTEFWGERVIFRVFCCESGENVVPLRGFQTYTIMQIGDRMPRFSVLNQDSEVVTDKDLIGKPTVLYVYPKDSTPGCTAEACNLRDNYHSFLARGYQVYGVSKDSPASHQRFIAKYELPFPLLSDPTTELLQALGAYGEKKMYGKTVMGTLRKTFVFNADGTLERVIEKVDTKNHTEQIL